MKTLISNLISLIAITTSAAELIPTDVSRVYGAGQQISTFTPQIQLQPGVYAIGDEDSKLTGTHYLILDSYINDEKKSLALMVNQADFNDGKRASGQFYMARPIKSGRAVMLSPVFIDSMGNLSVQSELNREAQVLEINLAPEGNKFRYPYIVQGHYGALDGKLMGMRAKSHQEPKFRASPSNSVFSSRTERGQVVVSGNTVGIHNGAQVDRRYEMVLLNGDLGRMAALVSTKFDTMAEESISDSEIQKLAFFMTDSEGSELFIIANKTAKPGQFVFDFYGPRGRSFLDYFAKGKTNP